MHTTDHAATIDADVRCIRCGYNLRSLPKTHHCPECGDDVAPSILAFEIASAAEKPDLEFSDVRWLTSLRDGAIAGLASVTLMVLIGIAPEWAFARKSRPREIMLGVLCASWVLAGFSVWKLGRPEKAGSTILSHVSVLRVCTVMWTAMSFMLGRWVERLPRQADYVFGITVIAWVLAGLVGSILIYVRVGTLMRRMGSFYGRIVCAFLAVINALAFAVILVPAFHGPSDSFSQLSELPTILFGHPSMTIQPLRDLAWYHAYSSALFPAFTFGIVMTESAVLARLGYVVWTYIARRNHARLTSETGAHGNT
jgi:hypothetical protein